MSWLNRQKRRRSRGVALIMAMAGMALISVIVTELVYDTQVEFVAAHRRIDQLRARYAAKAGVELSLLRILAYKKALAAIGDNAADLRSTLDLIWNFPWAVPPALPDDLLKSTREAIEKSVASSLLDVPYQTVISSEGNRLDINDLGSTNQALAEATRNQVLGIFRAEMEQNEDFKEKYDNFDFAELVGHIRDWIDIDSDSQSGGLESRYYSDELSNESIPPNQSFKTIEELRMVHGMTDDFFDVLAPRITIYGTKGINVNYASEDQLRGLDPQINAEIAAKIVERRSKEPPQGGPFRDRDEFLNFLRGLINTRELDESKFPLQFEEELNFRITAVSQVRQMAWQITAITYDSDSVKGVWKGMLDKENPKEGTNPTDGSAPPPPAPTDGATPPPPAAAPNEKTPVPTGRPTVVYWEEK